MYNMFMTILIHIIIALASIGVAGLALFKPNVKNLALSYSLIAATVASGSYLIIVSSSNILHSCLVGLAYLAVATTLTIATHVRVRRFASVAALNS